MKKTIICTVCPNGCQIEAEYTSKDDIALTGYSCPRGKEYGYNECFAPKRTFTASVKVDGAERRMLPVRSKVNVPKDAILDCAKYIQGMELTAPVDIGQVIVPDILGTGADIVASMTLKAVK